MRSDTTAAILWMCGGLSCLTALAIASRELTANLSTLDILFWRSLFGVLIVIAIMHWHQPLPFIEQIKTRQMHWHLMRNTAHFGGQCAWLLAIAAIPLAEVFALEFTTPFWTALLASLFLGERLNTARLLAMLLGFSGVLIILQPAGASIHPASLIMLAGAFGFAISIITTRHITRQDSPLQILFYMTAMQTLFAATAVTANWHWPLGWQWFWLSAAAVAALGAHYCLTKALSLADAAVIIPIDYLRLPLISLVAWWLYQEPLTWPLACGALLIIAGNAVGLYTEHRRMSGRR